MTEMYPFNDGEKEIHHFSLDDNYVTIDGVRALAVLTVSDHLITGDALPSDKREQSFGDMIEIALAAAFSNG